MDRQIGLANDQGGYFFQLSASVIFRIRLSINEFKNVTSRGGMMNDFIADLDKTQQVECGSASTGNMMAGWVNDRQVVLTTLKLRAHTCA